MPSRTAEPPALVSEGPLSSGAAAAVRKRLLDVVGALDAALRKAAGRAASEADRKACQNGTVLLSELRDCYDGRPWGAARLAQLSDDELLARCRVLPRDSRQHSAACELLVLRFYGNLTQDEIGSRLGISQMHVSRLLARALAHLRKRLADAPRHRPETASRRQPETA